MELFCPPTNILPTTIDTLKIHICKSKSYNAEPYLMPRIGSSKIKKQLFSEYGVSDEDFLENYKGKGVCIRHYPIVETYQITIEGGRIYRLHDKERVQLTDPTLLRKICAFHKVEDVSQLEDAKLMRYFSLAEVRAFSKPLRTRNANNSYSTDFYFRELESGVLPTGDEKVRK